MKNEKCHTCGSCGMPLQKPEDHAFGDADSELCIHCVKDDGTVKSYEDILQGTADYFVQSQGIIKQAALTMTRQLMSQLPYWKDKK